MGLFKISALGVAGLAASLALASASQAQVFNYTFSNASYSGNGDTAFLSGTFSWDSQANAVVSSDIDLTGTDAGNAVSCTDCTTGIYDPEHFAVHLGSQALYITFGSSLSSGGNVALSLFAPDQGNQPEYQGGSAFTTVTGGVTTSVPEPASWAMLVLGFGVAGYSLRTAKRRSGETLFA